MRIIVAIELYSAKSNDWGSLMNIVSMNTTLSSRPKWLRYGIIVLGIHLLGLVLLVPKIREYPQLLGLGCINLLTKAGMSTPSAFFLV